MEAEDLKIKTGYLNAQQFETFRVKNQNNKADDVVLLKSGIKPRVRTVIWLGKRFKNRPSDKLAVTGFMTGNNK